MKSLAIMTNFEMVVALRMSGFEGHYCKGEEELRDVFNSALSNPEVGMILISEADFNIISEEVLAAKSKKRGPLIVTIPGREGFKDKNFIMKYVKEAVGIKLDR
ncbi:V-type ATP synthase subunit F [Peptoniphilus equinus]|uniref:V-type ATP synthase subunit F n=1 Tax=Peptoniphilus equinus TaxID=3016343 RepID=A0ABY7QTH8_9FIRM|nr:V-type ATP synthase subunit F [Peptoniphilus equinus]WBW49766.1 V-type ATP synthase subunit F [Peptoniphilus equinus]